MCIRDRYTVDKNGVYNFSVRDYCGNILSYPVEVSKDVYQRQDGQRRPYSNAGRAVF